MLVTCPLPCSALHGAVEREAWTSQPSNSDERWQLCVGGRVPASETGGSQWWDLHKTTISGKTRVTTSEHGRISLRRGLMDALALCSTSCRHKWVCVTKWRRWAICGRRLPRTCFVATLSVLVCPRRLSSCLVKLNRLSRPSRLRDVMQTPVMTRAGRSP